MNSKTQVFIFKILLTLLFIIPQIILGQNIQIPKEDLGIKSIDAVKVYVKKVDYFNYKSVDYVIDSIDLIGEQLSVSLKNESGLFLISQNRTRPSTYIPFLQSPEIYHYMFCSNFYKSRNYIYLSERYSKEESEFFKWFYSKFTTNSFDEKLYQGENYTLLKKEKAKELIEKRRKWFQNKLQKHSKKFTKSFIDYINTEIELGAINQYLNWYEDVFLQKINEEVCSENNSQEHEEIYGKYLLKKWNPNSIQYYRFIERIVNYEVSKTKCEFKVYHQDASSKIKIAEQILAKQIFEKYKQNFN